MLVESSVAKSFHEVSKGLVRRVDAELLGKCFTCHLVYSSGVRACLLPPKQCAPKNKYEVPSWFLPRIRDVLKIPVEPLEKGPLKFKLNLQAALHNKGVLQFFYYDLDKFYQST